MVHRIKTIREILHLSQREFGEKLGVSRDVISNIENGRVQPKELLLNHMCQLYNVNEHWLCTGEGEIFNTKEEVNKTDKLLEKFNRLPSDVQDSFLELMEKTLELHNKAKGD